MFANMKRADTWKSLGAVTKLLAARLIELREAQEDGLAAGQADEARMNGVWPRVTQSQREASAERVRKAMHASGGNEIASNPARREAGTNAPDHFRPPSSNAATAASYFARQSASCS